MKKTLAPLQDNSVAQILKPERVPAHISAISELDFSHQLFLDPLEDPWFQLAALTTSRMRVDDVEEAISRETLLIAPGAFEDLFPHLGIVGNELTGLGSAGGWVYRIGEQKTYEYKPFYRFVFPSTSVEGEPLAFFRNTANGSDIVLNPDIWLFFELQERVSGLWWDQGRGLEAIRRRATETTIISEIRTDYLLRYLQARQLALLVGEYRHRHLFKPSSAAIEAFVKEDETLGDPEAKVKALIQNWGLRKDVPGLGPFLQRRLHLWYVVSPPPIDVDDPWREKPPFDINSFTLPTRYGPVAPARFSFAAFASGEPTFEGVTCDFMTRVYFRQEVLQKYEGADGIKVLDDGSVVASPYWSLQRSTARLGNELIATAIGDFAEGVSFHEWLHWKTYAVEPPSKGFLNSLHDDRPIPEVVNEVADALCGLNATFVRFAATLGVGDGKLWDGSLESPAGRRLKWFYPPFASEEHFLERATFASTVVVEGMHNRYLRAVATAVGESLHLNDEKPPRPLGGRKLLERLTLMAAIIAELMPDTAVLPALTLEAEGKASKSEDLHDELSQIYADVRAAGAALAFLYDLRTFGGLAHPPNIPRAREAALSLGLPDRNWQRIDYLHLLEAITTSVRSVAKYFRRAANTLEM